ncbi:MAG: S-methyl-5'-thioadenosine phosphorylase [Candidatus Diapherotrites archaeon]
MKIGIIGGSGLENPNLLEDFKTKEIETPFGKPSSPLTTGRINNIDLVIISRHGIKHEIPPTKVNNRANVFALKDEGCKYIISTTAVGSLREEIKRGDFVILDQFIDLTKRRKLTFFDKFEFGPIHTPMANPFSEELRKKLIESCEKLKFSNHKKGTVITIEGPRFSTKAESNLFKQWGASVINMSIAPECILANEAEIPYAVIAMSTDYDCWKDDEPPVTWDVIRQIMKENTERVKKVILETINSFSREQEILKIKDKIRTIPDFPKKGILFRDITPLLQDREGLRRFINIFCEKYKDTKIDVIAGIESRGFILAGILAERLNTGLSLIRKPGKLPYETIKQEYSLEYGTDMVEMHKDSVKLGQKVLLVDDLIATGGTAIASCNLIKKLGGQVVDCAFLMELEELGGIEKLKKEGFSSFSIVKFKEDEL